MPVGHIPFLLIPYVFHSSYFLFHTFCPCSYFPSSRLASSFFFSGSLYVHPIPDLLHFTWTFTFSFFYFSLFLFLHFISFDLFLVNGFFFHFSRSFTFSFFSFSIFIVLYIFSFLFSMTFRFICFSLILFSNIIGHVFCILFRFFFTLYIIIYSY